MRNYRIALLFVTATMAVLLLAGSLRLARGAGIRPPAPAEGVAALTAPAPLTTSPLTYTGPYSVTALGTLGGGASLAHDVNRHGHIVGRASITGNQAQRAFLWQDADHDLIGDDGEMENVGADDGLWSYATAIADSGYIAGVTVYDNCFCGSDEERGEDWLPFVRTPAGDLTELHGLGYIAEAQAINEAGTVVGSAYMIDTLGRGNRPAVWRDGNLSHPWEFLGVVSDINDDGDLAGGQYDAWNTGEDDSQAAVALIDGDLVQLGTFGGDSSSATAISNLGHVVGWAQDTFSRSRAFLWRDLDGDRQVDAGERVDLGTLGGRQSRAQDVNDAGTVVGSAHDENGDWRPFVWRDWNGNGQSDQGEMKDLNELLPANSGWVLEQAHAINEQGQIVGHGTFEGQRNQAFLLTPPLSPWTVFFYLDGDNNLDPTYVPIMNRLEQAADNPYVNVVVLWDRRGGPSRVYHVQHDEDFNALASYSEGVDTWSQPERDMSNPATLADFVAWGVKMFPARHYALVLDNHGSGLGGGLTDDSSGGIMSLMGMEQALREAHAQSGRRMDVLYMAMCLMGMLEDAYQLRDHASYYVANQTLQYSLNAPYENYIDGIGEFTTPQGVALAFAAAYADAAQAKNLPHSISVVDMAHVELMASAANALGQTLDFLMEEVSPTLTLASTLVQRYDSNGDNVLTQDDSSIDLYHFAELLKGLQPDEPLIQSAATILQSTFDLGVVYERHGDGKGLSFFQANGLAVFFPSTASSFYNEDNYAFAVGGWSSPSRRALQNEGTWASMLVSYIEAVNPDGPDDPEPPPPVSKLLPDEEAEPEGILFLPFLRGQTP